MATQVFIYPGMSSTLKHSIVRPSPFVPSEELLKGFAQADCAAVEGENVEAVCERVVVAINVVELKVEEVCMFEDDDTELREIRDPDDVGVVNDVETESFDVEFDIDAVEGLSSRLTLVLLLESFG